ncbi:MAG: Ig-like domain-containing protein [Bacteroidaceae bacterium]|nr:Ig-like domain-containing protein [Bacteroidaceae bacterium]
MNIKNLFKFVLVWVALAGVLPAMAAFKDVKIDLSESSFLEASEKNEDARVDVSLGLVIGEDGSLTRVAADDATADVILSGKWWNSHGWSGTTATVKVEGSVKIGIGGCQFAGHTIKVTDAAGNEVASFAAGGAGCWEGSKADDLISYAYYTGEATTLTISIPSYCPYLSVEKVTEIVKEATVNYSLGDVVCEGTVVPASVKVVVGEGKVTVPANFTLYVEGKTLTGWTDGTDTYAIGAEIAPTADMTLTPVFTENTVALGDRKDAVTLKWDFQQKSGAPVVGFQGQTGIWVGQAVVNGETIDVKVDFDTNNGGKIANANWNDLAQMNEGTKFVLPSCMGAVVSMEAYNAITTTTIDGQSDYTSGNTINYTVGDKDETVEVVIGDGSYYRWIQIVLPFVEKDYSGTVFENTEACVTWPFNSTADYATAYTTSPEGAFSMASVNTGDLEITGTGKRTAGDGGIDDVVFLKLKPSGATQAVEWGVKPARGLSFTPTKVSGYIQRFGTDAENGVTVTAILADGTTETLGNFTAPRANHDANKDKFAKNSNSTHQFVIELTAEQQAKFTSTEGFALSATVGVGASKEGGFSDIRIYGTVNGTVAEVAKYAVTPAINMEEAGAATIYPISTSYEEGSAVTLTATENFGYNFVNWTNAAGEEVSTDAKFSWEVSADETLTANFVKVNTYALDLTVEAPANDYMVQWYPAPTIVDGKNMYEEGTKVTLTTSNNYIMNFAGWSNDETASEIVVSMTQDVTLTAKYEASVDFIAGWDFIRRGGDGRVADFAAADNDADQLVLRDAEGNTSGWLDKSQEAAGGYEGKPAAVNWRNNVAIGTYYYQIKVNAEAFTDIKVYAEMLYNYNAYQKQDVEYSLDNETWTLIGSINMSAVKTWTPGEFALPAEANNQKELYIRWKADTSSKMDGSTSDNDGTSITNIFVTGTMKLVDDGKAPVLVSTTPKEGATNASANGKVVLSFDEKVKVAEGAVATLNGVELTPVVSGKSVMFEYKSLEYSTEYTFSLPANSISDLTDNAITEVITVNFATKTKPAVTKALYDFIVPDDGNFKEALEAAAARSDKSQRFRIFVKKGQHIIPGNNDVQVTGADGKSYADPKTYFNTPNVSIIGEDMAETSVANYMTTESFDGQWGPAHPLEGIRTSGLLYLQSGATNTYFEDITLKSNTPDSRGRNVVLVDGGNKTICKDVCLWAYQDTYVSDNGNSLYYFEGGVIRGRTDFICGSGDVFFNAVDIVMCEKGGYIVAPRNNVKYGYVFKDCVIKGENEAVNGNYYLGRPWTEAAETYYIDCVMEALPTAAGWTNMSAGGCTRFAEYNSTTAAGTAVDLTGRVKQLGNETPNPNEPVLTAVEAAEIGNMANMFGDWDPTAATEQASAPTNVKIENSVITWDNSDYVLLWAVCKDGKVIDFTTEPTYTVDDATATYSVRAANEMGGLGEAAVAVDSESIEGVIAGQAVVSTEIFNANGVQLNKLQQGINIVRKTYANGAVVVEKVMK